MLCKYTVVGRDVERKTKECHFKVIVVIIIEFNERRSLKLENPFLKFDFKCGFDFNFSFEESFALSLIQSIYGFKSTENENKSGTTRIGASPVHPPAVRRPMRKRNTFAFKG